jgi:hypothetical protein
VLVIHLAQVVIQSSAYSLNVLFPSLQFALDSLSLTLQATSALASDEAKVVKSTEPPVLNPGKNTVPIAVSPQREGTYVLQALTGERLGLRPILLMFRVASRDIRV